LLVVFFYTAADLHREFAMSHRSAHLFSPLASLQFRWSQNGLVSKRR
jgi:hypothetical protein